MNETQLSVKPHDRPSKCRSAPARSDRGIATYALTVLIVSSMIVWFCFLGWGIIAMLQALLDYFKNFWAT